MVSLSQSQSPSPSPCGVIRPPFPQLPLSTLSPSLSVPRAYLVSFCVQLSGIYLVQICSLSSYRPAKPTKAAQSAANGSNKHQHSVPHPHTHTHTRTLSHYTQSCNHLRTVDFELCQLTLSELNTFLRALLIVFSHCYRLSAMRKCDNNSLHAQMGQKAALAMHETRQNHKNR